MTRATSPGTALTRTKVSTAVPRRVTADQNRRVTRRAAISYHFLSRVEATVLKAPEPDRVGPGPVQARAVEDGNLLVEDRHPGGVAHGDDLRPAEQPLPLDRIGAGRGPGEERVELRVVVKGGVVAILVRNPLAVQQNVEEIARVGVVLHPAPQAAGHLPAGAHFDFERGVTHRFEVDLD